MAVIEDKLIEQLAAIEHERWADWQKWCHKVLRENNPSPEQGDILERWDKQIETSYEKLSESEKQSDRDQVKRYWPLITQYIEEEKRLAVINKLEELSAIAKEDPNYQVPRSQLLEELTKLKNKDKI